MSKAKEPWNGRDWYVSFGEFPDGAAGKMQSSTGSSPPEAARACPVDHGTGSRSQMLIEATSMVPW